MAEIPLCSDLLVRFFPASTAWVFLRELPIAGYSRTTSDDVFHINFALFGWQKDPSDVSPMDKPSHSSACEAYGMEMLWSLGYKFQDKYNDDTQWMIGKQEKDFYNLCCTIWRNLKLNHCYRIRYAIMDQTPKKSHQTSSSSSQLDEVAFAVITPYCIEYQPMQKEAHHRGFEKYPSENWLLVHMRDYNGIDKINNLDLQTRVRFRNLMIKGISRDQRVYRYFGSSNSQMKDQAGWFLSIPQGKTMDSVREGLGDLSQIRNVSTYTARVGLYLTTTKSTGVTLDFHWLFALVSYPLSISRSN